MKEGRMKGQAFIGLPNEKAAAKALKEANGYVLFEKPMVVVSFSLMGIHSSCKLSLSLSFAVTVFYGSEVYGKRKHTKKTRQHSIIDCCYS